MTLTRRRLAFVAAALSVGVVAGVKQFHADSRSSAAPAQPSVVAPAQLPAVAYARLAGMVLPLPAYGPEARRMSIDSESGTNSNAEAGRTGFDAALTAAYLTSIGRITAYELDFIGPNGLGTKSGLAVAMSEVQLFRTVHGASELQHLLPTDILVQAGKHLASGVTLGAVKLFSPGPIGDDAIGLRVHVDDAGGLSVTQTSVTVRLGTLLASVELDRADGVNEIPTASRLARTLVQRIRNVLAGRIHPTPVPLPLSAQQKLGGLGRPPGGPDLAAMALRPRDFATGAAVGTQRYDRNPDDIAEYVRELKPGVFRGAQILELASDVELQDSVNGGRAYFAALRTAFGGGGSRQNLEQFAARRYGVSAATLSSFEPMSSVNAGDGAFAVGAIVTSNGVRRRLVIVCLNVGPVVTTLSLLTSPPEPTRARLAALVQLAAAHTRTALR